MADQYLVINGVTHHLDRDEAINEKNLGVGYERRGENSSMTAGMLKDSYGNWSPYVGGGVHTDRMGPLSLGLSANVAYRQKAEGNGADGLTLIPMVTGEVMITDKDGVNIGFLPPIEGKTGGVTLLQYKRLLGDSSKKSEAGEELERRLKEKKATLADVSEILDGE